MSAMHLLLSASYNPCYGFWDARKECEAWSITFSQDDWLRASGQDEGVIKVSFLLFPLPLPRLDLTTQEPEIPTQVHGGQLAMMETIIEGLASNAEGAIDLHGGHQLCGL